MGFFLGNFRTLADALKRVTFFRVHKGRTRPQGLLLSTVLLTLTVLAINYSLPMIIAPQYGHYGGQLFCSRNFSSRGHVSAGCTNHPEFLQPCTEKSNINICTPTVVSTFINRVTLNFPFFGAFAFWAQFAFLGVFIVTTLTSLIRTPKGAGIDDAEDEFAEEEEEESLLGASRRRLDVAWEDIRNGSVSSIGGSRSRTPVGGTQSYGTDEV